MGMTLQEVADQLNATLVGNGDGQVESVAGIRTAGPTDLAYIEDPKYDFLVESSRAAAVIVPRSFEADVSVSLLQVDDPRAAFDQIVRELAPPAIAPVIGVHPSAVIAEDAELGTDVSIGACAVIEPGARIGARTVVGAGSYIGSQVVLGEAVLVHPNVTIKEYCEVGDRTILHSGVVIGADGFGYDVDVSGPAPVVTKIPQLGNVVIGTDTEIGANSAVDRARFGSTKIGNHVKVDNLVQIAHNCEIGDYSGFIAQVGVAGSTLVGSGVRMWGQSGTVGHVAIGDGATILARAVVSKDVPAGTTLYGDPGIESKAAMRQQAAVRRLPEMRKQVADLERRIKELEARGE